MTARATRAGADATGNTIPSSADFVAGIAAVQGVVTQLRVDIKDRFDRIDGKLDNVCIEVDGLKTTAAVNAALAQQDAKTADSSAIDRRWIIGLAVGVACSLGLSIFRALGGG